jgi:hypothetical protein
VSTHAPGRTLAGVFPGNKADPRPVITSVTSCAEMRTSNLALVGAFFDIHVLEFTGFKDLAAFLTLDEFRILVPAHNLHARVPAGRLYVSGLRGRGRLWSHNPGRSPDEPERRLFFVGISGILDRHCSLSSPQSLSWCEFMTKGRRRPGIRILAQAKSDRNHRIRHKPLSP